MKNRIVQALLTALLISSMIVSPVFATTLEDMQKNKDHAETEASSLQEQLTQTLDKIDTLEADLDKKQEEVEKAGDDLEEAAAKQTEQYESMKLRIKYMYEEGNSSLLETLFSSTSFTDLLNKAEYVAEVHSYDRDKLSEYEATTKQVETMKNDLQDEYEQMQTMQTELEGEKASLTATLEDKQSEIAQLDQSIQDAIAARQEAERKAQEEAAQAAAAAANTQTNTTQNNTQQSNNNSNSNSNSGNSNSNSNNNSGNSGNNSSNNSSSNNSGYVPPQGRDGAAVVAYARQFIGNPYVYGGNSLTNGIDCSGFTQQIYAAFGVSLPRVDSAQALCGVEIPLSQAKAGDLLCYYGHVGIYNGSGGIIHASSPGVGIVEFSNCQYRTLRCVRRVL